MTPLSRSEQKNPAGSPTPGEPAFLAVGKLHRPHGVHGEISMEILTDFPERLKRGVTLYLGPQRAPLRLTGVRSHDRGLLVTFEGYTTPEQAGELRNQVVYVSSADRPPLEEGEYYHHQILGLRVLDESGRYLGRVKEILETGSNDVFVLQPDSAPEILIPALDEVILKIDLEHGEMQVHLLPGLIPGE